MKIGDGLMTSKSGRQRTSGPQKRSKSDFIYCSQCSKFAEFWNFRDIYGHSQANHGGLQTLSKTVNVNLDCAFVKKNPALFTLIFYSEKLIELS